MCFDVEFEGRNFHITIKFGFLPLLKFIVSSFQHDFFLGRLGNELIFLLERIDFTEIFILYISFQFASDDLAHYFIFFKTDSLNFLNSLLILIDLKPENFPFSYVV